MAVRLAQPTDAVELALLNEDFNDSTMSAQDISNYLARCPEHEKTVVAEIDGDIVGFGCLQIYRSWCYADPWGELTELFVKPEHRRGGLGQAMVSFIEALAKDAGATEIILLASIENAAGQALYRRCGYAEKTKSLFSKELAG